MERIELRELILTCGEAPPIACKTPCSLQGVLAEAGVIAHPFVGTSLLAANERCAGGCTLRTAFTVREEHVGAQLWLCLSDVVGSARVSVNGATVFTVSSPYRLPQADISALCHVGENELCLAFDAPGERSLSEQASSPCVKDVSVGRIELCVRRTPSILYVSTDTRFSEDGTATLHVSTELFGAGESDKVVATLTSPGGSMYYAGLAHGEGDLHIADPAVFRVGTADTPLYRLSVTLYRDDTPVDEQTLTVALSDLRITGEASHGRRDMTFTVGGEPTFIKSCTYRRPSLYPSVTDTAAEETAVRALVELGFNMVRIPADEPFPSEHLLSLLDRHGILVWKRLPSLPTEPEARATFLADTREHLRRVGSHPCLAVVSAPPEEDNRLLVDTVHKVSGRLCFMTCTETARPNDTAVLWDTTEHTEGVQIESFPICTPPPSVPSPAAIARFAGEDSNLYGRTVEHHALGVDVPALLQRAAASYPFPHGGEEAAYVTERYRLDVASAAIAAARGASPIADGIHIGELADLYPSVGRGMIDAYGQRCPLYYGVRRSLSPVALFIKRTDYRVHFLVHNDRPTPYVGRLVYTLCDRDNRAISSGAFDVTVEPYALDSTLSTELSTLVFGHEDEYYLHASLDDGRVITPPCVCLFTAPKYFAYAKQDVRADIRGQGCSFEVLLRASSFVHGAYLSFGTLPVRLHDNLVDLTGDMPVRIALETQTPTTAEALSASLSVISLNRIGRA